MCLEKIARRDLYYGIPRGQSSHVLHLYSSSWIVLLWKPGTGPLKHIVSLVFQMRHMSKAITLLDAGADPGGECKGKILHECVM